MRRSLAELTSTDDPAWPLVQQWIAEAKNHVEVLAPSANAPAELEAAQVTLRSPMGAIVYHTGGLLMDHGWIRVLGSGGHPRLQRSLMGWNQERTFEGEECTAGYMLIADDVLGGFFAGNGGGLGPDVKNVYYFAPDTLRWESLGRGYTDFLLFALNSDLEKFYSPFRWAGWQDEIARVDGDQALSIYPYLWTKEGKDITRCTREAAPIAEVYGLNVIEFPRQLDGKQ